MPVPWDLLVKNASKIRSACLLQIGLIARQPAQARRGIGNGLTDFMGQRGTQLSQAAHTCARSACACLSANSTCFLMRRGSTTLTPFGRNHNLPSAPRAHLRVVDSRARSQSDSIGIVEYRRLQCSLRIAHRGVQLRRGDPSREGSNAEAAGQHASSIPNATDGSMKGRTTGRLTAWTTGGAKPCVLR